MLLHDINMPIALHEILNQTTTPLVIISSVGNKKVGHACVILLLCKWCTREATRRPDPWLKIEAMCDCLRIASGSGMDRDGVATACHARFHAVTSNLPFSARRPDVHNYRLQTLLLLLREGGIAKRAHKYDVRSQGVEGSYGNETKYGRLRECHGMNQSKAGQEGGGGQRIRKFVDFIYWRPLDEKCRRERDASARVWVESRVVSGPAATFLSLSDCGCVVSVVQTPPSLYLHRSTMWSIVI